MGTVKAWVLSDQFQRKSRLNKTEKIHQLAEWTKNSWLSKWSVLSKISSPFNQNYVRGKRTSQNKNKSRDKSLDKSRLSRNPNNRWCSRICIKFRRDFAESKAFRRSVSSQPSKSVVWSLTRSRLDLFSASNGNKACSMTSRCLTCHCRCL